MPREEEVVSRYARALVANGHRTALQASRACHEDLGRRHLVRPGQFRTRNLHSVCHRLAKAARNLGWSPHETYQAPEEFALLDRYAVRYVAGEFSGLKAAAEVCLYEMRELHRRGVIERLLLPDTVALALSRRARRSGVRAEVRHWSTQEDKLLDRFVAAVMEGKYRSAAEAGAACWPELERLRRSSPGRPMPRDRSAVVFRIGERLRARRWQGRFAQWTRSELRVLTHYARALAAGAYRNGHQAARDCLDDLMRRHEEQPQRYGVRTQLVVAHRLRPVARGLGWPGAPSQLHSQEKRLLERYVMNVRQGRFPSIRDAATACREALKEACARQPALQLSTVVSYLSRRLLQAGHRCGAPDWSEEEDELARRYARAVVEGRFARGIAGAGSECLAEMTRRKLRAAGRRTASGVGGRIREYVAQLALPCAHGPWSDAEMRIVKRYARGVVAGRYASAVKALRPCYYALAEHNRNMLRNSLIELRGLRGRTRVSVHKRLMLEIRALGRHGRPTPRWTPPEQRHCLSWVKWYDRQGGPAYHGALAVARDGLSDDLARAGFSRTPLACRSRITIYYRLSRGLHPTRPWQLLTAERRRGPESKRGKTRDAEPVRKLEGKTEDATRIYEEAEGQVKEK